MNVPGDTGACDNENKQVPPLSAWGYEYAVVPTLDRSSWLTQGKEAERDPSVIRIVGSVDGTKLVYEPRQPEGAQETIESGQLARFFTAEPFVVRSQDSGHPFYVASVMTGSIRTGTLLGDPETAIAIPTDQWLDSYGFFSDNTYAFSALFVTRRKLNGEFRDVTLDCAGVLTGWRSITDDYEWTFVELSCVNKPVAYPEGTCNDGTHRVRSEAPFSMSVWGIDSAASYSYPGGAGLRPISDVHVPAIVH
jgi:IgGFc binding protein